MPFATETLGLDIVEPTWLPFDKASNSLNSIWYMPLGAVPASVSLPWYVNEAVWVDWAAPTATIRRMRNGTKILIDIFIFSTSKVHGHETMVGAMAPALSIPIFKQVSPLGDRNIKP